MKKKSIVLGLSSSILLMGTLYNPDIFGKIASAKTTQTNERENIIFIEEIIGEANEINEIDIDFINKLKVTYSENEFIKLQTTLDSNYEVELNEQIEHTKFKDVDNNKIMLMFEDDNLTSLDFSVINRMTNVVYNFTFSLQIGSVENTKPFLELFNKEENDESIVIEEKETINETEKEYTDEEETIPVEKDSKKKIDTKDQEDGIQQNNAVESILEEKPQPRIQNFSNKLTLENGFYTIQPNDTFIAIAKKLNLSVLQLQVYNPQIKNINSITVGNKLATTRQAVESNLSETEKAHLYTGNGNSYFENQSQFFDYLYPYARDLANSPGEERLYVSIILAQAALESGYGKSALSSPPYNNLTGIKRKGNEDYVKMWTREETKSGESFYVLADFKVYPSYYEALKGNADLIRYRGYYNEVWVKYSPTYRDAVDALDRSPYATDTNYGQKILSIINRYNLNKYDFDTILSVSDTNYDAQIKYGNSGIYTLPKYVNGSVLYTSYLFNGEAVKVVQDAVTESGVFSKVVRRNNGSAIGWIKKNDLNIFNSILSQRPTSYYAQVKPSNSGIYTSPQGTYNSILYTSYLYNWKDVKIVEEATTEKGTFSKIVDIDDGHTVGWINKADLSTYNEILNRKEVEYFGQVRPNNSGIYTTPQGTFNSVLYTTYKYNWKNVKIVEEVETTGGVFSRIVIDQNNQTIGWIKKSDLSLFDSHSSNYYAQVRPGNAGIYTAPNPIRGKLLYTSYLYNWKDVIISNEVYISGKTYSKLERIDNKQSIGWIEKNDLVAYTTIQSRTPQNYITQVRGANSGIYTLPRGSYGAILYTSYKYNWKDVHVVEEVTTQNDVFVKINRVEDGSFIGWINKSDIVF